MLAQDGSALVLARATDMPSSPAQGKGKGEGKKGGWKRVDSPSASPNDATYFVACFICTIKRRPIRLSYSLSGDFPSGWNLSSEFYARPFVRASYISHSN